MRVFLLFICLFVFFVGCKTGLVRAAVRFVIYFFGVCIGYFIIGTIIGLFGITGLQIQLGSVSQSAVIKRWGGGAYNGAVHEFTNFNKAYDSVKRDVLYNILIKFRSYVN